MQEITAGGLRANPLRLGEPARNRRVTFHVPLRLVLKGRAFQHFRLALTTSTPRRCSKHFVISTGAGALATVQWRDLLGYRLNSAAKSFATPVPNAAASAAP